MRNVFLIVCVLISVGLLLFVLNAGLYGLGGSGDCSCHKDDQVINNCGMFCGARGSFCSEYCLRTSVCQGGMCNSTWIIECGNGQFTEAGGAEYCLDCVGEDGPAGGSADPIGDGGNPDFTPLDASGNPMW